MIKKGVYAASLSVLNDDYSLNVKKTISHAEFIIKKGLHGVFFFGSTGQSQLITLSEKKELISQISSNKNKNKFFIGTGCNSLNDTINIIDYSMEYGFNTFLIMPPAYYKNNTEDGVMNFYSQIVSKCPKSKIILYNFEKLSGFRFEIDFVKKLVNKFPKNIIGCKDSSYNLYEKLKIKNFLMFPGSEEKLLKGLNLGCAGCISAVTNVTHHLARKVFDDFESGKKSSFNNELVLARQMFDKFNLISALHSFMSINDKNYTNLLPPLTLLSEKDLKILVDSLKKMNFMIEKNKAA